MQTESTIQEATPTRAHDRVLVLIDSPFPAAERTAADAILAATRGADVLVVAPAQAIPGERWVIDLDARESQARLNLESWITALAGGANRIRGEVGDEHPGLAVSDAVAGFAADEVHMVRNVAPEAPPARRASLEWAGRLLTPPAVSGPRVECA